MSMTKNEANRLRATAKRWREEANNLSSVIQKGQYADQTSRVRFFMVAHTLRRCARAIEYQLKTATNHARAGAMKDE